MMNKNAMVQECNGSEFDMQNGDGFFSSLYEDFKENLPDVLRGVKDVAVMVGGLAVEVMNTAVRQDEV